MKMKKMSFLAAIVRRRWALRRGHRAAETRNAGRLPLQEALQSRRTGRSFSDRALPREVLSNLLWSAIGVNRDDGRRTAPTALNRQEITLYVCIPEGTFRYDAAANKLVQTSEKRAGDAPLMVIFTADTARQPERFCHVDCGFVGQNIYLFCASQKLATVFRASFQGRRITGRCSTSGRTSRFSTCRRSVTRNDLLIPDSSRGGRSTGACFSVFL